MLGEKGLWVVCVKSNICCVIVCYICGLMMGFCVVEILIVGVMRIRLLSEVFGFF